MEVSRQASTLRSSGMSDNPEDATAPVAADRVLSKERTDNSTVTDVKPVDKRSLDYVLRSGLAGGLAGCAGKTVVAPLDRVKILFQASNPQFAKYSGSWSGLALAMRDIHKYEGSRGLFKGHSATLLRIFPYAAIKFLAYEQIRAVIIPSREKETPFRRLISGSLAGVTSVFFTYPLEVVRVRMAFETKRNARSSYTAICKQIYHEQASSRPVAASAGPNQSATMATAQTVSTSINAVTPRSGLANFYRGFAPTILGMIPYAGISFLTHDTVGDILRLPGLAQYTTIPDSDAPRKSGKRQGKRRLQLTASAELFSGAAAGLVSQTSAYPLEVIRRRMQVGGATGDGHRLSIAETARKIFLERGFRGFWVGLTIGYLKIIPMSATSFFVYERMKWYLGI
ncbi:mitochondrial carrier protein (Leu5), putative [Talaromyces stipitatus ATCC 10500]|uniref:Mitochondrial thiamine pyrophosphate carrier 1 n=1 Tax=Talaromyces stipitatus (strain ATCC 10500 / CBS 375.48 / QM 6759 / NRRL 1006) TaxID=441959 RepID=B8MPW5_TALSN|nr:mitochondrial carrier protein (Leu5), putative [Talaromyces stipitatus ATCC 10500]EED12855.1 mitochondrial carrier protein (Leu5), putative [Talaromyces stipitatus ATCC 10500]